MKSWIVFQNDFLLAELNKTKKVKLINIENGCEYRYKTLIFCAILTIFEGPNTQLSIFFTSFTYYTISYSIALTLIVDTKINYIKS